MIVETLNNTYYSVTETGDPDLAHVWFGQKMKKSHQGFVPVKKIHQVLVRKEGCRVLQS
jgi:hypothetical protein